MCGLTRDVTWLIFAFFVALFLEILQTSSSVDHILSRVKFSHKWLIFWLTVTTIIKMLFFFLCCCQKVKCILKLGYIIENLSINWCHGCSQVCISGILNTDSLSSLLLFSFCLNKTHLRISPLFTVVFIFSKRCCTFVCGPVSQIAHSEHITQNILVISLPTFLICAQIFVLLLLFWANLQYNRTTELSPPDLWC